MGSRNGFDADMELDELQAPVNRGSGTLSIAQRQANALANLGLNSGTINPPGGFSGLIGAVGTNPPQLGLVNTSGQFQTVIDDEQYAILSANYVLSNVNTAQKALNASANGAITLAAGSYVFEFQYIATNTGTTSHTWATLFGGTAVITSIIYSIFGSSQATSAPTTGGTTGYANVATAVVGTPASTSATENVVIEGTGILVVGTAGTLIPQIQLSAAPGGTQTMLQGSFFRIWGFPQLGAVGTWS